MYFRLFVSALIIALAGCATPERQVSPNATTRPLDVLPPGFDPALVRSDLLATARERFGAAALDRATTAPTHLIVKRFAGMPPPPPPGAGPDWRTPTPAALLIRDSSGWLVATPDGWRAASAEAAAQLDFAITSQRLWSEPVYTPPCPDFGASNLLLKAPGRRETVRNALCSSGAADVVQLALSA